MFLRGKKSWAWILLIAFTMFDTSSVCEAKSKKRKRKDAEAEVVPRAEPAIAATFERDVMLVSAPKHATKIQDGATIAFVEFDHVIPYSRFENMNDLLCVSQVSSALAQHLADLNRFRVVTRDNIQTVMDELAFGHSGNVNSETAAELGELIGADILIYGKVQLCSISKPDREAIDAQRGRALSNSLHHVPPVAYGSTTGQAISGLGQIGADLPGDYELADKAAEIAVVGAAADNGAGGDGDRGGDGRRAARLSGAGEASGLRPSGGAGRR